MPDFDLEVSQEDFCSWLIWNEKNIVGRPGTYFHDPLALYLSSSAGKVCGVAEKHYGLARCEAHQWRVLPRWASLFRFLAERYYPHVPLTGSQAFALLAQVETVLSN